MHQRCCYGAASYAPQGHNPPSPPSTGNPGPAGARPAAPGQCRPGGHRWCGVVEGLPPGGTEGWWKRIASCGVDPWRRAKPSALGGSWEPESGVGQQSGARWNESTSKSCNPYYSCSILIICILQLRLMTSWPKYTLSYVICIFF